MYQKLISDRRLNYPAIKSFSELLLCANFLAYDSRQQCFVAIDPTLKQIQGQIFPFSLEQQKNILYVHFRIKAPNAEMKAEIQNQIRNLIHASDTSHSILISDELL